MQIWNACRGIDWQALDMLAEIHGVSDIETLVAELLAVRSFQESLDG